MEEDEFVPGLGATDRAELEAAGRPRTWAAGELVFREGDRASAVVLIRKGRVKVFSISERGDEIVLAVRGPGALLGDMSAVDGGAMSASGAAMEPVQAHVVPVPAFLAFLQSHPAATVGMLRMIVSRLRDADRKRVEFGAYDTLGRVALRLAELADRFGARGDKGIRITVPFTQDELAGWVGASREAVTKALRTLRDRGAIETHRKGVSVLDLDLLVQYSRQTPPSGS